MEQQTIQVVSIFIKIRFRYDLEGGPWLIKILIMSVKGKEIVYDVY